MIRDALQLLSKQDSILRLLGFVFGFLLFSGCASLSLRGNEGGSEPINDKEQVEYQKALLRCNKSGGSRVVKITGTLRCY